MAAKKEICPHCGQALPDNRYAEECFWIIGYLNEQAGRSFQGTESDRKYIRQRLKEGFEVEDFKTVIDKKIKDWVGTEFEKYLRPQTLFGPKFDGYLQEKSVKRGEEGIDRLKGLMISR